MIEHFNWIDIGAIIVLFRVCYIALKNGLIAEFFKTLGTIFAIYISLHYYIPLSVLIRSRIASGHETVFPFMDFVLFVILSISAYLIFVFFREAFSRFIKTEALPSINKYGGLLLGIARAFLLIGLIMFALVISSIDYLKNSVTNSYSGDNLLKIAPTAYTLLWDNVVSKFSGKDDFNKTILDVQDDFNS
jgi:uncharacterized membrane protein required for colicin V production